MPTLTAPELEYLRDDHPHKTLLYMSVFKPATVYVGQVTGSPERGQRQIEVVDSSGSIGSIQAGMTAMVGTSSGLDNVSRRRVRSVAGQIITFDENSVAWANGQFITVIEFWEMWPVFPFITDTEPYTFYKDFDIAYSDQNEFPNPVAIAGPHQAGYLSAGSVAFPLDASDSYAIASGATITSYLWACADGVIANTAAATTTITFDAAHAGGIYVALTVTDSNGKTQTTRRVIFVHERTGANMPHKDFNITSPITGTWQNGGYLTSVDVYDNALVADIPDRTLVLIWQEPSYAGTVRDIGALGNALFIGYIRTESIQRNLASGKVTFDLATIHEKLHSKNTFSVSLTDDPSPDTWWKYKELTVTRAVHHLWKWQSTLFDVADVFIDQSSLRLPAVDDFSESDLLTIVDAFTYQHGIHAHACCNKLGQMYVEIDIQMLNDAGRNAKTVVMDVTARDRRDEDDFSIRRVKEGSASLVMLSGVSYDGTTVTPLISKAPGEVPDTDGVVKVGIERQVLASQADANERAGRYLALTNNIITDGQVRFAGNYSFVDIVPQEWYTISMGATENKRGIVLADARMVPRSATFTYDPSSGTLFPDVLFDIEATGEDGIPGRYPIEIAQAPPGDPPPNDEVGMLLTFGDAHGCYLYTSWANRNGGLSGANIQDFHGGVDPWWFVNQDSFNPGDAILWKCNQGRIYRSVNQGQTWVNMTPSTDPPNDAEDDPAPDATDLTYMWYEGNTLINHQHVFLARWQNAAELWRTWLLLTEDDGTTWQWKSVGGGGGGSGASWQDDVNNNGAGTGITDTASDTPSLIKFGTRYGRVAAIGFGATRPIFHAVDEEGNELYSYTVGVALTGGGAGVVTSDCQAVVVALTDDLIMFALCKYTATTDQPIGTYVSFYNGVGSFIASRRLQTYTVTSALLGQVAAARVSDTDVLVCCNKYQTSDADTDPVGRAMKIHYNTLTDEITIVDSGSLGTDGVNMTVCVVDAANEIFHAYHHNPVNVSIIDASLGIDVIHTEQVVTGSSHYAACASVSTDGTDVLTYIDKSDNIAYCRAIKATTGGLVTVGAAHALSTYPSVSPVGVNIGVQAAQQSTGSAYVVYSYNTGTERILGSRIATVSGTVTVSLSAETASPFNAIRPFILSDGTTSFDDNGLSNRVTILFAGGGSAKGLGLSLGKGVGESVYVTIWDNVAGLGAHLYALPSLTEIRSFGLGGATEEELDSFAKIAYPYALYGDDNWCLFYGRYDIGGIIHLASTEDGGLALFIMEDDFGERHVGALAVDYNDRMYAVVNDGSIGVLCTGYISLQEKFSLPFQVGVNAILPYNERYLLVGAKAVAGGQMILQIRRPFDGVESDLTLDHPTTGSITAIVIT